MKIHPSAIVENGAEIGEDVEIGPQAYIGPEVSIGDSCVIGHGSHIEGHVTMGENNFVGPYSVLGTPPQDLTYHGQKTELIIGDDNVFREFVTVNIGTVNANSVTRIGDRNYLMICSHVGHDCVLADDVLLVNGVLLGGHCHVEVGAKLMGAAACHQFVTIGRQAYVGGLSRIVQDVPPFMIVEGNPSRVRGVNEIGLERAGYSKEVIRELGEVYKAIYRTRELNRSKVYEELADDPDASEEAQHLVEFLRRSQEGVHGRYLEGQRNH